MSTSFSQIHKSTVEERRKQVEKLLEISLSEVPFAQFSQAEKMVENCIGIVPVPLGIATNFLIDGKSFLIPMAIEEPSVIAAACNAAKTIAQYGQGFRVIIQPKTIHTGQILIDSISKVEDAMKLFMEQSNQVVKVANSFCTNMVNRGGGVKKVSIRPLPSTRNTAIIDFSIDTCDSMGANCINTMLEAVSPFISNLIGGSIIARILSNDCPERVSQVQFRIKIVDLAYKNLSGNELVERILKMDAWARNDPLRCATHNKGIMNGIQAVAVALGQDWRAINAAAYSFYSGPVPFTRYHLEKENLVGEIRLPIPVGVVGGATDKNPFYRNLFKLMGDPSSADLSAVKTRLIQGHGGSRTSPEFRRFAGIGD